MELCVFFFVESDTEYISRHSTCGCQGRCPRDTAEAAKDIPPLDHNGEVFDILFESTHSEPLSD